MVQSRALIVVSIPEETTMRERVSPGGYCDEKSPSNSNSQLFDSIINPLLSMTIRGAIWYQVGQSEPALSPSTQDMLAVYESASPAAIGQIKRF
jgi:hypothetical protein